MPSTATHGTPISPMTPAFPHRRSEATTGRAPRTGNGDKRERHGDLTNGLAEFSPRWFAPGPAKGGTLKKHSRRAFIAGASTGCAGAWFLPTWAIPQRDAETRVL